MKPVATASTRLEDNVGKKKGYLVPMTTSHAEPPSLHKNQGRKKKSVERTGKRK